MIKLDFSLCNTEETKITFNYSYLLHEKIKVHIKAIHTTGREVMQLESRTGVEFILPQIPLKHGSFT